MRKINTMIIFFIIISINVISAEVTNDTKFINSLPENVKKVFLAKVSRRILDEVPEVESGEEAMADGEIIDAKLEEQSEFVSKILREEIDSLKARRQNTLDDKFEVLENNAPSEKNTSLKTSIKPESHRNDEKNVNDTETVGGNNDRHEHIDLTLRARSKRWGENDHMDEEPKENNNNNDDVNKDKKVSNEVNENNRINIQISKESQTPNGEYKKKEKNDIHSSEKTSNKTIKLDNQDVISLPLNARVSQNIESADFSVAEPNSATTNDLLTNSFRTENNHDSSFNDKENISNEFLENTALNENLAMKKVALKPIVTAIPVEIFTEKSDGETKQGMLTTIPSLIMTSTSFDVTTRIYEKVILNPEIIRKSPKDELSKTVLRTKTKENKFESISNNESMQIQSNIKINLQTEKPCNTTGNVNSTKSDCEKAKKQGNSDIAQDINSKKLTIVQVNEINLRMKKPCNKTNTLNVTKSDCAKSTNVQIMKENNGSVQSNDDKSKYFLTEDSRPSINQKQSSSSAEHFGDLRGVKERKVNVVSNRTTFDKSIQNDNAEQPRNFTVYKYETNNVHYNAYNHLGPNVDDHGNKDESYESKSSLRDNLQDYNRKHSFSAEHFGDLQVATEYQVFEVDANKPSFVQENKDDNVEQPNYFLVYNYDPKNVHYNAYNRFGPNVDDNVERDDVYESNLRDAKDTRNLDLDSMDNDKTFQELSFEEYKRSARIRPRKPKFKDYEMHEFQNKFMPESFEVDHPFQAIKKGLKNRLEATRHILHRNKMFGYVPTNQERTNKLIVAMKRLLENNSEWKEIIGSSKEDVPVLRMPNDKEATASKNTYVVARDHDIDNINKDESTEKESEDKTKRSYQKIPYSRDAPSELNILWNRRYKKVTINGMTYNHVDDDNLPNQQEARNPHRDFLKFSIVPDKLNENSHDNIKQFVIDTTRNKFGSLSSIDQTKMTKINSYEKRSQKKSNKNIGSEREGRNRETKAKFTKKLPATPTHRFEIKSRPTIDLRSQYTGKVDSERNLEQSGPPEINTIEQVINMTPEIDMLTNIEEMNEKDVPIMRSRDKDLELHVNILKDMVKMGNPALERYDWLGTTVDVLAALTKLLDLINRKESLQYIHPSDLEILKYTEAIYEAAKKFALERKEESNKLETEEYEGRVRQHNRKFPKTKKKIRNALKVINKMYKVRSVADKVRKQKKISINLEEFLTSLQNALNDFHNLITQISIITKYKSQRWYKNIKELYLVKAESKEYLEILLHLFSTRLFGLIEESSKNGANLDHKAYIKKNRAQVDRTEVEVMFILRILEAIKNSRN